MEPDIDLNKPVENPELVARLRAAGEIPETEDDQRATDRMLLDGIYLLAAQVFHPDGGPAVVDGVMRAGTQINLYTVGLPDDRSALVAFTDWPSLHAAVGEGDDWSGLVQKGPDVFSLGSPPDYPGGVVINPFGPKVTLEVGPERIARMTQRG